MMDDTTTEAPKVGIIESIARKWQYILDKSSPHVVYRWVMFAVVLSLYILRVYLVNGWYIVTYGLGIYLLNQLIGFLSPQVPLVTLIFKCRFNFCFTFIFSYVYWSHLNDVITVFIFA